MNYHGQLDCSEDPVMGIFVERLFLHQARIILQGNGVYDGAGFKVEAGFDRRRSAEYQSASVHYTSDGWEPLVQLRIAKLEENPETETCEFSLEWFENEETWLLEGELERMSDA